MKTIEIGEHLFELPAMPKRKDEILFVNENKHNAYWRRDENYRQIWYDLIPWHSELNQDKTYYDDNGILVSLNKDDSDYINRIYQQEMYRRRNGIWFKNGDDIEYMPGAQYFFLQWCKLPGVAGDYGQFMKYQRDHLCLKEHVWNSPDMLGIYTSKAKKTGISALEMAGYYLNKATMTAGQQMGIMNVSQEQASIVNMMIFFHAFDGLPNPFKPRIKQRADDAGYIIFGDKPFSGRGKAALKQLASTDRDSALNTRVYAAATKGRGFDSPTMNDIAFDELPKYDTEGKQDPEEIFNNNQETVKIQTIFNGRIWAYSYPPEQDTDGYAKCRKIYFDSKLKTKAQTQTGRTKTGMICYHISSLYSHRACIDKYGNCDAKKAFYLNDSERKAVHDDPKAYQAKVRQYAIDEKEAWAVGGKDSVFNNIRLSELMVDLEDERSINPMPDYVPGRLEWGNKLWEAGKKNSRPPGQFCDVEYIPLTKAELQDKITARMRVYQTLPDFMANQALKHGRDELGNLMPPPKFDFIGAADPTDYAGKATVIHGSKNAMFVMNMPNEALDARAGKIISKILFSEYLYRAANPNESYEDFVKAIIYYDLLMLVESNKMWVINKLIEDGLGYHCLVRDKETKVIRIWEPDKEWLPVVMEGGAKGDILGEMVRVIYEYFDYAGEEDKDYGAECKADRLMEQMTRFKTEDTTEFDLVVCFGWLLIALYCYEGILLHPDEELFGINDYIQVIAAMGRSTF